MQEERIKALLDFLRESIKNNVKANKIRKKIEHNVSSNKLLRIIINGEKLKDEELREATIKFSFNNVCYKLTVNYIDIYDKNIFYHNEFLYKKITKISIDDNINLMIFKDFKEEINLLLYILDIFKSINHHVIQQSFLKKWCLSVNVDFLVIRKFINKERNKEVNNSMIFTTRSKSNISNIQSTKSMFSRDMEYVFWLENEIIFWEHGIVNILEDLSSKEVEKIRRIKPRPKYLKFDSTFHSFVTFMFFRSSYVINILKKEAISYKKKGFDIVKFSENQVDFRKFSIGLFYQIFYESFNEEIKTLAGIDDEFDVYKVINNEFVFELIYVEEGTFIGENSVAWNNSLDKDSRFALLPFDNFHYLLIRKNNEESKIKVEKAINGKYNKFYIKNIILRSNLNYGILLGEEQNLKNNQDLKNIIEELKQPIENVLDLGDIDIKKLSYSNIYDAIINNEFEFLTKEIKKETGKTYIGLKSII